MSVPLHVPAAGRPAARGPPFSRSSSRWQTGYQSRAKTLDPRQRRQRGGRMTPDTQTADPQAGDPQVGDPQAGDPGWITYLIAAACGLIAANLYFAQPLIGLIGPELG